jgi:hypothetical protein
MVLKKFIKALTGTILFLGFIICFSCEEIELMIINCNECNSEEPENAELEIKLEENRNMESTIIRIYLGSIEDSLLVKTLLTIDEKIMAIVSLNKTYTIEATYHIDETNYTAINTVTPRVKYFRSQCADPCYYIYDRKINLRLNYY